MFKLTNIKVEGLPGFEENLVLDCNPNTTVLIGPNGSGKTTTLSVIDTLFSFLNKGVFDESNVSILTWIKWNTAVLSFSSDSPFPVPGDAPQELGSTFSRVTISVTNQNDTLRVTRIETEHGMLELNPNNIYLESSKLTELQNTLVDLQNRMNARVQTIKDLKRSNPNHASLAGQQQDLDKIRKDIGQIESSIVMRG
ncbi:MAG: AAA family ATPase [Leptospirales bacterium]|nr:AAA family ATPase [Leptospirales bacterium]